MVREIVAAGADEIIVVDNGSTDDTAAQATAAGARVVSEPRRGYGQACAAGVAAVSPDTDIVCFMDGDGSDVPSFLPSVVTPLATGEADFVMGSRLRGVRESGSMTPQQIVAGKVAELLLRLTYGVRFTDMSPFRAMRLGDLRALGMSEQTFGWNLEMQMRVAAAGLRVFEVPVDHRCRRGGVSKVSGDLRRRPQGRLGDHTYLPAAGRYAARRATACRSRRGRAMRTLLTGGAGFIGQHVLRELVARGHDVCVLDSLREDVHGGSPWMPPPGVAFVHGDVRDAAVVDRALQGRDSVLHLAAKVGLGVDVGDLPDYASSNDVGTAVLLAGMARARIDRLVLASSMVVYGEGVGVCPAHGTVAPAPRCEKALAAGQFEPPCPVCGTPLATGLVSESAALDPRNAYASSKVAQEFYAANWARTTGGTVAAMRYHNVYGPGMPRNTPYAGVAAIFTSALRQGKPPQVFEDGGQRRGLRPRPRRCRRHGRSLRETRNGGTRLQRRLRDAAHRWRDGRRTCKRDEGADAAAHWPLPLG